jgi:hypothetical protein
MLVFQGAVPEIRPKGGTGKNKFCFFTFTLTHNQKIDREETFQSATPGAFV